LGDLAIAEQIQPPSVTKLVRTLEQDGFLTCYPDAADRRCTRVVLTMLGEKEVKEIRARKTEFLEQRLALLSAVDQQRMSELAELLESLLES
jgi:DNA-binding MarR family transcriptional regulator